MTRVNQRERTRLALLGAAGELLREGHGPSLPDAAERALVSLATAYRYFASAEELWHEATGYAAEGALDRDELRAALDACGDDVEARLEAMVTRVSTWLIDHDVLARQSARSSLDWWFAQRSRDDVPPVVRQARRREFGHMVLEPLRGRVPDEAIEGIVESLGMALGPESVVTLLDVLDLDPDVAKQRMLTTARWILRAGLAELDEA